jgi:polyisoprenoid-binding protein YceI
MRLELSPESRVHIDLRATGLLRAVGHDPTLTARPEAATIDLDVGDVSVRFPVRDITPPEDLSPSDRGKMTDNLRSAEVLDAARFPVVAVQARYEGGIDGGRLTGQLVVRGAPRHFAMEIRTRREGEDYVATGAWEGTLTDLGIKPFKALFGALKLSDWIRVRVEAWLRPR